MKPDERELLLAVHQRTNETVRAVIARLGIPSRRANYLLRKWEERGLYTSEGAPELDLGWLTIQGDLALAKEMNW